MREIKQNTDANVKLFLTDETDHITGITGLSTSLSAELCKDDDVSFSSITVAASGSEIGYGWYNVILSDVNSHTDTIGDLIVRVTATGADSAERLLNVVANVEADTYTKVPSANIDDYKANVSTLALESTSLALSADIQNIDLDTTGLALESTSLSLSADIQNIEAGDKIIVQPVQGNLSYNSIKNQRVEIKQNSTAEIGYSISSDLSGYEVYFGIKEKYRDTEYILEEKNITSDLTEVSTGTGFIKLTDIETDIEDGDYIGELKVTKIGVKARPIEFKIKILPSLLP